MIPKNCLTCTIKTRTLYAVFRKLIALDATTKKLLGKLLEFEQQIKDIERQAESEIKELQHQADSIKASLRLVGIKPESRWEDDEAETEYALKQPFANLSLVDTCKRILDDFPDYLLTKSEVEYLAGRGGYKFSAKDSANSVDVTLRRLAQDGLCYVQKSRGPKGNTYSCQRPEKGAEAHNVVENPRTTSSE
jgi:hypothetical protein